MATLTLMALLSAALFSYAVGQEPSPVCVGPTEFCEDVVAQSGTIEEAWQVYGASNVELTKTVLSQAIEQVLQQKNDIYQQCMFSINQKFDGLSVSTMDRACRRALKIPTERGAIDKYSDRFFNELVIDLITTVAETMTTLHNNGGDCNNKWCAYLITETFPRPEVESKEEKSDGTMALKRILENLMHEKETEVEQEEGQLEERATKLKTLLGMLENEAKEDEEA